jgi:hypothetical protein
VSGREAFYFFLGAWYIRGNVVHVSSQEEKAKDNPWFFGAPGNTYGPSCPFPPPGEGKEEISGINAVLASYGYKNNTPSGR